MPRKNTIAAFTNGVHSRVDKEMIPRDAAASSLGWVTKDGHIELTYGRQAQGAEGSTGKVWTEHTAFDTNGDSVRFRKIWDGTEGKIQYLNGTTWTDTITGLGNCAVTFTNYASLAGNAVYIGSPLDGLFKIMTANPGSYADMYDSTKNFKGYNFIDKGRMIMWNTTTDSTGLYGSYIDSQDSDVYTTVSSEALAAVESGTLAFKAGGSTRTCFGVQITDTSSGEVFTDNYDGTLTGDAGSTGTINYMTGAFTITGQTGAGTADYQWVDDNANGVTDFSKSATRLAGQGFVVRQDAGGDEIKTVTPFDGSYFSFKANSVYQFTLDVEDTNPSNELIRTNVGVSTINAVVGTSAGIVYMDTGNPSEPTVSLLHRNISGDNFTTQQLFDQFEFADYTYADVALESWDDYIVIACNDGSEQNNRVLLCNMRDKTVDPVAYDVRCFTTDSGLLYGGSPFNTTSYELFTGFDDMGGTPENIWESASDSMGDSTLKKTKRLRIGGEIDPEQSVEVYISNDNGDYQQVGTIHGTGDYVDYTSSHALGTTLVGNNTVGGDGTVPVYRFLMQIKMRTGKFRTRQVKFVATGIGYVHIHLLEDFDIWLYQDKLPRSYRQKQNVSIDGLTNDQDTPEY